MNDLAQITGNKRNNLDADGGEPRLQRTRNRAAHERAHALRREPGNLLPNVIPDNRVRLFSRDTHAVRLDQMNLARGVEDGSDPLLPN